MKDLAKTYLKYGVPSDLALKYEAANLSATEFRKLSAAKLEQFYGIPASDAKLVKEYLDRQPIDTRVMEQLLVNNNFTCCCCKGVKSDGYVVHHIVKYELSQDNSYANLAVLCPNDHDLAHRATGLTSGIGEHEIRTAKADWEQLVQVHRLAAASPIDLNTFYLKIPRYQKLHDEIDALKRTLEDKDRIAGLSSALLASETEKNALRLKELEGRKDVLETQVKELIDKISQFRPEESSALQSAAIARFLSGDIAGALDVLSENALDAQMDKLIGMQDAVIQGVIQNIDDRILRATLLLLDGKTDEACKLASQTLTTCDELSDRMPDLVLKFVACHDDVGSIYFNADLVDEAEAVFSKGLYLARRLCELDDISVVPYIPGFLHDLGTIEYARGHFEPAASLLEEAALWYWDLKPAFDDVPGIDRNPIDDKLVKNLTNLATTYDTLGRHEQAADALARIEQLANAVFAESDTEELRVRYLLSKATVRFRSGDFAQASALFEESVSLLTDLAEKYPKMYARDLADTCLEAYGAAFKLDAASPRMRACCVRAVQAGRRLVAVDPGGDPTPLAYALTYHAFHLRKTDPDDGNYAALVNEAMEIVNRLAPESCDPQLRKAILRLMDAIEL